MRFVFKPIVEEFINPEGDNVQEAQDKAARKIVDIALQNKWDLSTGHYSIGEMFNAFCNFDGRLDVNDTVKVHEAVMASAFPYITKELINPILVKGYNYSLFGIDRLVFETDSTHPEENIAGFTAARNFQKRNEGRAFEEGTVGEKRFLIKNHDFGLIVNLTQEMLMFDQTGSVVQRAYGIGQKIGAHRHKYIAERLQDVACTATGEAANTTLNRNGSTAAIYSDNHAAIDGQTNDNNHTTAFGHAGMAASWQLLQKMLDEEGDEIIGVLPRQLLVPVALAQAAWQLKNPVLGNYAPTTTTRESNFFTQGGYLEDIVSSPVLDSTSTTKFYTGEFNQQFVWQWVERPATLTAPADRPQAFKSRIVLGIRFSYWGGLGATDYRFVAKGGTN